MTSRRSRPSSRSSRQYWWAGSCEPVCLSVCLSVSVCVCVCRAGRNQRHYQVRHCWLPCRVLGAEWPRSVTSWDDVMMTSPRSDAVEAARGAEVWCCLHGTDGTVAGSQRRRVISKRCLWTGYICDALQFDGGASPGSGAAVASQM